MKKLWYNLKWLFTSELPDVEKDNQKRSCDYCGETDGRFHNPDTGMTICWGCMKKIADKVLKEEK